MRMRELVKSLYKDEEGNPFVLSDSQCLIFYLIFTKKCPRVHLQTFTQFGKSLTVALAVLTRVATFPDKFMIVAGREKQANIVMSYIIQHAFDNEYTKAKLELGDGESEERLQRERSKKRLTFRHSDGTIGEVMVLSADSRNTQTAGDAVMGFGAGNVVLDEAALIDDDIEAKIFRMLGGRANNFYLKIGNPFRRNHFYLDSINPDFFKVNIDWRAGVSEGRVKQEFINEAIKKPLFDILYENKFPPAELIDDKGFVPLLNESDVRFIDSVMFIGEKRMGIDPSGEGSDKTKWVVRDRFGAKCVATEDKSTPLSIALKTVLLMQAYGIKADQVFVDNFGEGANVAQELARMSIFVRAVNVGDKLTKTDLNVDFGSQETKEEMGKKYYNLRAYAHWMMRAWLIKGALLEKDPNWDECKVLKYKANLARQIQIMSKDEMRRQGIRSPNQTDALMLTFVEPEKEEVIIRSESVDELFDPRSVF